MFKCNRPISEELLKTYSICLENCQSGQMRMCIICQTNNICEGVHEFLNNQKWTEKYIIFFIKILPTTLHCSFQSSILWDDSIKVALIIF